MSDTERSPTQNTPIGPGGLIVVIDRDGRRQPVTRPRAEELVMRGLASFPPEAQIPVVDTETGEMFQMPGANFREAFVEAQGRYRLHSPDTAQLYNLRQEENRRRFYSEEMGGSAALLGFSEFLDPTTLATTPINVLNRLVSQVSGAEVGDVPSFAHAVREAVSDDFERQAAVDTIEENPGQFIGGAIAGTVASVAATRGGTAGAAAPRAASALGRLAQTSTGPVTSLHPQMLIGDLARYAMGGRTATAVAERLGPRLGPLVRTVGRTTLEGAAAGALDSAVWMQATDRPLSLETMLADGAFGGVLGFGFGSIGGTLGVAARGSLARRAERAVVDGITDDVQRAALEKFARTHNLDDLPEGWAPGWYGTLMRLVGGVMAPDDKELLRALSHRDARRELPGAFEAYQRMDKTARDVAEELSEMNRVIRRYGRNLHQVPDADFDGMLNRVPLEQSIGDVTDATTGFIHQINRIENGLDVAGHTARRNLAGLLRNVQKSAGLVDAELRLQKQGAAPMQASVLEHFGIGEGGIPASAIAKVKNTAEMHASLRSLREALDTKLLPNVTRASPNGATAVLATEVRSWVDGALSSQKMFGEGGKLFGLWDQATYGMNGRLDDIIRSYGTRKATTPNDVVDIDPGKIKRMLTSQQTSQGDTAFQNLRTFLADVQVFAKSKNFFDDTSRAAMQELGERAAARYREMNSLANQFSTIYKIVQAASLGNKFSGAMAVLGIGGSLVTGGLAAAGAPPLVAMLAGVGVGGGLSAMAMRPSGIAVGLSMFENAVRNVSGRIGPRLNRVRDMLTGATVRRRDRTMPFLLKVSRFSSAEDKREAFDAIESHIRSLLASEQALISAMSDSLVSVAEMNPEMSADMTLRAMSNLSYLAQHLPTRRSADPFNPDRKPGVSLTQIDNFLTRFRMANDPTEMLNDMADRRLTLAGVDATRTMYPRIYQEMIAGVMDIITNNPARISYQGKMQVALATGMETDATMDTDFVSLMTEGFAQTQAQMRSQGPGRIQRPNIATFTTTASSAIEERREI